MKKNLIYSGMIAAALITAAVKTNAQTDWHITGNAGTNPSTNFVGTTDAVDLKFRTNNAVRMTMKSSGRIGIGSTAPAAKLHVQGGTGTNDTIVVEAIAKKTNSTVDFPAIYGESVSTPDFGFGVEGIGNYRGVIGIGGTDGVVGVGFNGTVGFADAPDTLLATGEIHGAHGQTSLGHWAIGTAGFATDGAINYGALGYSPDTATTSPDFGVFCIGDFGFTGKSFDVSDAKFKKDVKDLVKGVDLLAKLRPTTYYFRTSEYPNIGLSGRKQYGFVAQEVEQYFPELVKNSFIPPIYKGTGKDKILVSPEVPFKAVDYMGVIPIIVQAVNEQQDALKAKDAEIAQLKSQVASFESRLAALENTSSAKLSSASSSEASLEQNNPNPFSQSTEIRYTVPKNYSSAQIIITSIDGKAVRTYSISGTGKGQITLNANELSAGSYTYSLNVDGKVVDSKTLVLTK